MLSRLKSLIADDHPLRLAWHRLKAHAAAVRYGFPAWKLTVIGITGTDGKTTTVGMMAHILRSSGLNVGALSTAFFQIAEHITWNATQKTSPSPFTIQKFLRQCVDTGCTHAVLEYSSHGLVQGRTLHTRPSVAAITNLTPEHLDYHKTMEEYARAKSLLFTMLNGRRTKVLNRDDVTYEQFSSIPSSQTITYGTHPPQEKNRAAGAINLWISTISAAPDHIQATLHKDQEGQTHTLSLPIAGTFNLENALCAIGCALGCGIGIETSLASLQSFHGIPGRMEKIDEGQPFTVYVDFTVTPASYEKTLTALSAAMQPGKRLLVLTGSCGDRMKEKRPIVGKIVSEHADIMVVTNEDPYSEDPEKIIDEVWAGIDHSKTKAHRISERKEAIEFLLSKAQPGDTVLLCGKGSDTTMWTKHGKIPWNERGIVRQLLKNPRSS